MPKRRHNSRRLAPSSPANRTNSRLASIFDTSCHGTATASFEPAPCQHDVSAISPNTRRVCLQNKHLTRPSTPRHLNGESAFAPPPAKAYRDKGFPFDSPPCPPV